MGAAAGVAEDVHDGLIDRFRSLPLPSVAVIAGRVIGDTAILAWTLSVTVAVGFGVGFRFHDGAGRALAALGLCVLWGFAFTWLFVALGFVAGSPQAAQGLAFLVFPLTFVSSAYVPVGTMPGWLQAFARHQPLTLMADSTRILTQGHAATANLGHGLGWYLPGSLLWAAGIMLVCVPVAVWRLRRS